LKDEIGFLDIARINEKVLQSISLQKNLTIDSLIESDAEARAKATELI
jgi:1-deoxy-D-xylulose 5-phosphate reductoisomerase